MNNYHTYDELGRGKYSVVYKVAPIQCRKQKTLEYLAIKSVDLSRRKKLMNEVRILNTLDHTNILKFYTWYETKNHLWIVFGFCAGGDLKTLLNQDKHLPESTVRHFGYDLMTGLLYLHRNGIIYADLKPSNVLFTEDGILKLSDFGLAKRIVDLVTCASEQNHAKRGTPYYMAPELFQEDGVYSFYSDLWSLGCVMYEMITGSPPFTAEAFQDLIHEILTYDPPQISGVSPELEDLLQNLLQKDPAKRITWEELVCHTFWGDYSRSLDEVLPSQPHYEANLVKRGVSQRTPRPCKTPDSLSSSISELRLSQVIQKTLVRESLKNCKEEGNHDKELEFDSSESEYEEEYIEEMDFECEEIPSKKRATTALLNNQSPILNTDIKTLSLSQNPTFTKSVFKPEPLESLIFHTTDSAVKPIIGNRDIEKPDELNFDAQEIHIKVWSTEELRSKSDTPELESHLSELYTHISNNTTIIEKMNLLVYFEMLLIDSQIANKLINSAFVELFVRILKITKSHQIKVRICDILGCMIRHATLIETELATSGVCNILCELTKDKNEKVKRKAMAALGEYLFYAATQMDEESYDPEWVINNTIIILLARMLKTGDDEVLRYYTTKTIENITAQTQNAGVLLCIPVRCM
jgi:serine/threonine-protein kinase ULK4